MALKNYRRLVFVSGCRILKNDDVFQFILNETKVPAACKISEIIAYLFNMIRSVRNSTDLEDSAFVTSLCDFALSDICKCLEAVCIIYSHLCKHLSVDIDFSKL